MISSGAIEMDKLFSCILFIYSILSQIFKKGTFRKLLLYLALNGFEIKREPFQPLFALHQK